MSTQFNLQFGQDLCDMLHAELSLVCNFMDGEGRIVASSDRERIGQLHPVARRVMQGEMDECSVSAEEAARSPVMREGMLTAIDLDGRRLICFTMAGPLPVVRPLVRIVRFCVTALLQTTGLSHTRHPPPAPPTAPPASNLSELLHHAATAVGFSITQLHQAIEHIDEGVSMFDAEQRLVVWNQRYLELSGWPDEAACRGHTLQAMVLHFLTVHGMNTAEVRDALDKRMQRLREGRGNDFQVETPDGLVMAIADRPLPGGGTVSTYTDISAQHRAMLALKNAREDAEKLVRERTQTLDIYTRLSSDWFWESDSQFRITGVQGDIRKKLGIGVDYFVTKRHWEHPLVGVSEEQLREHIAQHERHEVFRDFEYGLAAADGTISYLSVSGAPRFDATGQFLGYHGTGRDITERRRNQALLQERTEQLQRINAEMEHLVAERTQALSEQLGFLRQLLEAIPTPIFYKDTQARYLGANTAFEHVVGKPVGDIIGKTLQEIEPTILTAHNATADHTLLEKIGKQSYEGPVHYGDGSVRQVQFHKATFLQSSGAIGGVVGVMFDITERKRMEDELRQAATFFDNSTEAMVLLRTDGTIAAINRAFTSITGFTREDAVGHHSRMLHPREQGRTDLPMLEAALLKSGGWQGELLNLRKNGEVYPVWISLTSVKDKLGHTTHFVATFSDISQRKQNEERIQQLAFHDPLTGLANRRLLMDRLEHALAGGLRNHTGGVVLLIDVDNFKTINDTRGHDVGDQLLKQVAHRLLTCLHEGDTVARMSGDEFVVLVENLPERTAELVSHAKVLCGRLLLALEQPYELAGEHHHYSASVGITLFGNQPTTVAELIKQADMAMYRAKEAGRNTLSFFDPQMQASVDARTQLERAMREALRQGDFIAWYQPQVNADGHVLGVEALVRWRKEDASIVAPGAFIALAEETGLIVPIGEHMLRTACRQLNTWAQRPETANLTIAVNVSARQFHHEDFARHVLDIVRESGAPADRLKLEITESLLIDNIEAVIEKMQTLKSHGVGFSLDDFGTGYSSLAYLKRLPLDQLKIDQGFVRGVLVDGNDAAIARMVVALADSLSLQAIAEGVETSEQLAFLRDHGCRAYQGYLFSRPVPIAQLETWLAERLVPSP